MALSTSLAGAPTPAALARWAHWPLWTSNPYYALFYGALAPYGVTPVNKWEPTLEWLDSSAADVVHVHWPDALWRRRGTSVWSKALDVVELTRFLSHARQRGVTIVWTAHNRESHEGSDWIDMQGYRILARYADLIICHSQHSHDETVRRYRPAADVVTMPLGNFDDVYPEPRPRDAVLAEWGLDPTRHVLTSLGYLRGYKGLERACDAVARLDEPFQLVIAGPRIKGYDLNPLRRAVALQPHVRLIERRLTDQEFADLTAISEASLLPYSQVTTSGALLASWSLGTGAVVSDLPFFREITASAGEASTTCPAHDTAGLVEAIRRYVSIPREVRHSAALAAARRYDWADCVLPVARWIAQRRASFASSRLGHFAGAAY